MGNPFDHLVSRLLQLHWKNGATVLESTDSLTGETAEFALVDDNGDVLVSTGETWEFCNECGPHYKQSWPCATVKLLREYGYDARDKD